eukprot:5014460-Prymnesium_polylepis.2
MYRKREMRSSVISLTICTGHVRRAPSAASRERAVSTARDATAVSTARDATHGHRSAHRGRTIDAPHTHRSQSAPEGRARAHTSCSCPPSRSRQPPQSTARSQT